MKKSVQLLYDASIMLSKPPLLCDYYEDFFYICNECEKHMGRKKAEAISQILSDLCEEIRQNAFETGFDLGVGLTTK